MVSAREAAPFEFRLHRPKLARWVNVVVPVKREGHGHTPAKQLLGLKSGGPRFHVETSLLILP